VLDEAAGVGDADGPPEGEGEAAGEAEVAGEGDGDPENGDAVSVTVGDAVTGVEDGLGLVWPGPGPSAKGRGWAASTATPSASRLATARIGTSATPLPSGKRSRQFGQKPDTGIVA
jgi:hypothetical protein